MNPHAWAIDRLNFGLAKLASLALPCAGSRVLAVPASGGFPNKETVMIDKVGDELLTTQKAAALLKQVKEILEQLKPYGITLTTDDRKRTLRPRKGAEKHIQRVHELATKHEVSLKNIPLAGMADDLALATQFQPFENELRTGLQFAEDTGTQAGSEAWEAFLAYYGVLSSMAERSPDLAAELQTVVDFMALGPRKKGGPPTE